MCHVFLTSYAYIDDISVDECGVQYVVFNCCILSALDSTRKSTFLLLWKVTLFPIRQGFEIPLKCLGDTKSGSLISALI